MGRSVSVATAVAVCASLWIGAPALEAQGVRSSTTDSSTTDVATTEPATTEPTTVPTTVPPTTMAPATRGSTIQIGTTLPPPPTTAPRPPSPWAAPANSGTGRRVVYSKGQMRVWIIEADGYVTRSYRVSGRLNQPAYGTYSVFSRSAYTCSIGHSNVCMRWMVRFAHGINGGNIGFHEIPRKNGVPMQSDAQLGLPLSSGCVRQSTADAFFMWNWAGVGTKVVVIR